MELKKGDFIKVQRIVREELGEKTLSEIEFEKESYIELYNKEIERLKSFPYQMCFFLNKLDKIIYDGIEIYKKRNPYNNRIIEKFTNNYNWLEDKKLFNNIKYSIGTFYDIDNEGNFIIKLNGNTKLYEAIKLEENLDNLCVQFTYLGESKPIDSNNENYIYKVIKITNVFISYFTNVDKNVLEKRNRINEFKFKGVFKENDFTKPNNINI